MLIGTAMVMLSLFLLGFESPGIMIFGMQFSSTALLLVIMSLSGLGMGMALPAANNACIELMPDRVATITGIRGMFRLSGGAIAIAIISLLLQRIGNMALGFSIVFFGLAVIVLITVPAIFGMPRTCETPLSVKDIGHDTD
jgi:MFS family permease